MSQTVKPEITHYCRRLPSGDTGTLVRSYLEGAASRFTLCDETQSVVPERGLLWIQGNAAWFPAVFRRLRSIPKESRPIVAVWHNEPLPPPRSALLPYPKLSLREIAKIAFRDSRATDVYTNYWSIRRLSREGLVDVLVVSAAGRKSFLAERGISSHFVPFGYDLRMGRDLGLARDIDVLFLGALNVPRRNRVINFLRTQGINVIAVGDWSNPAYWGEQRTALINRAKILLNVPRTAEEFSGARILLGLANRSLVISEPMFDSAPYVPGRHFVMAPVEQLPGLIRHYLSNDSDRGRIVDEGHRLVSEELSMDCSVQRILHIATKCGTKCGHDRIGGRLA